MANFVDAPDLILLRKCGYCIPDVPYNNVENEDEEGENEESHGEPVFSPRASVGGPHPGGAGYQWYRHHLIFITFLLNHKKKQKIYNFFANRLFKIVKLWGSRHWIVNYTGHTKSCHSFNDVFKIWIGLYKLAESNLHRNNCNLQKG